LFYTLSKSINIAKPDNLVCFTVVKVLVKTASFERHKSGSSVHGKKFILVTTLMTLHRQEHALKYRYSGEFDRRIYGFGGGYSLSAFPSTEVESIANFACFATKRAVSDYCLSEGYLSDTHNDYSLAI